MVELECPIPGCNYRTPEGSSETVACTLLSAHSTIHMGGRTRVAPGPKLERPKVDSGLNQEEWNLFIRRWDAFVNGSGLDPVDCSTQLFQCASDSLGDSLLRSNPGIMNRPTDELLASMRSLAVVAVATCVTRTDLMNMHQERDEQFRIFASRVRGKAETCNYKTKCSCNNTVDFTDSIIRDILIAGIEDSDIRREILGVRDILDIPINDIIALVESKEMARDALPLPVGNISSSSYRRNKSKQPDTTSQSDVPLPCPVCKKPFLRFTEGRSGRNKKPHKLCIDCYRAKRRQERYDLNPIPKPDGSNTGGVGAMFSQVSGVSTKQTIDLSCSSQNSIASPHNIFSKGEWRRSNFKDHPRVELLLSVLSSDYRQFGKRCPKVAPTKITALADTCAQSCLWSLREFESLGFTIDDLIPVNVNLNAANKSPITIEGAARVRLQGIASDGSKQSCAAMVYVSRQAEGFYLSFETMIDLGIVPKDFPAIKPSVAQSGHTINATVADDVPGKSCSCPTRTSVPEMPKKLPFECVPENNDKMKRWLLDHFGSSTFNTCPHQRLPLMDGPPVEIHLKENAVPRAVHTPASIPIHWQDQVHKDLLRDEALGVIEKVPYGEPVTWCHRMVVTRKHDGSPRRTVDLSPLNKHCERETFATASPFKSARRVPPNTWRTVNDAWNGFHSVPLRDSDRHLTTFITPFGRWRYRATPQGFSGSGDGYNRRFDQVISDFERKERVTDDVLHYDTSLEEHWWRTLQMLTTSGNAGIIMNPDKLQFAQRTVDFAGFRISEFSIEPLPKYTNAIRNFPTPKSITDIRSWFGLVNQVSNYAQLRDFMEPFRRFLSPRQVFQWSPELEHAFQQSKESIIQAIKEGVIIFDPSRKTCLRPDWSRKGIGYFLYQQHCDCSSDTPDCCNLGWRIVLAGSRFLSSTEQRYAPVEGEALAAAWSLEQSKYFTQGCPSLIVVTDHEPLIKILGDRTLDEITNDRIFRLKQRTLPWSFKVYHLPGKTNLASDATSRYPSAVIGLMTVADQVEEAINAAIRTDANETFSINWDQLASETAKDPSLSILLRYVQSGFDGMLPDEAATISEYWRYRDSLYVLDDVLLYQDRVVVPPSLRQTVLSILHSANQGVTAMSSRAQSTVFWPGISKDINGTRANCVPCNRNAPSQPAMPAAPPSTPSTPFEMIFADFFSYAGFHYLLAGDRLSGWVEVYRSLHGSSKSGAKGLTTALRSLFATFGVPEELSSDGGPEFSANETKLFLKKWGVRSRVSSAYFPQSNGRAEVAVKKCKRLLMENINPNGSLSNDRFLRALLQMRNTPDADCKISPAEIIFGKPLRDAFSFVNRLPKYTNPSIRPTWRDAWTKKEEAMLTRFSRSSERLNQSARQLPPLSVGENVLIQNQHGNHPTKWDKSGVVVEVGDFDQYVVKVDGSHRVTLRNRRFLRKFAPATSNIQPTVAPYVGTSPCQPPRHRINVPISVRPGTSITPADDHEPQSLPVGDNQDHTSTDTELPTPLKEVEKAVMPASKSSTVDTPAARSRPRRSMRPPPRYEPETGTWS